MRWMLPGCLVGLIVLGGCSKEKRAPSPEFSSVGHEIGGAKEAVRAFAKKAAEPTISPSGQEFTVLANEQAQPAPQPKAESPRKIKYTSEVKLIVDNFADAQSELKTALKNAKAWVAHAEVNNSPNTVRNGTWRIRVPVENFESFRDALLKLGEPEQNTVDSEDMTAQFYDLEAHVKNRQAEREAIRKLLEKVGDHDIKQVLEVKRELNAITDDINRKEGQLRLWASMTDLSTINLTIREKQKYLAPPAPNLAETPTFVVRAGKTWSDSWDSFLGFCQVIALCVITLTPWLPVFLVAGTAVWLVGRRLARTRRAPLVVTPIEASASKPA